MRPRSGQWSMKPMLTAVGASLLAFSVTSCVPGGIRVSTGGVMFSTNSLSFLTGGLFGSTPSSSGQSLPTAINGPRPVAATFHNEVACEDRIGLNYGEGFLDPATGSCTSCPPDFVRVADVPTTDPAACIPNGTVGFATSAEDLGPVGCDDTTFQIGDACYSCPVDMTPTGSGDVGSACMTAE